MAVKKVNTKSEVKEEVVEVDVTEAVEAPTEEVSTTADENIEEVEVETPEVEIPEVSVDEPSDIEVDEKSAEVDRSNQPNGNVKIRMRVDHKCCIAMERYDLKAGKTYVVPANVKGILNRAGLLAPL